MSGSGDSGDVHGTIEVEGASDVSGYVYGEDDEEVAVDGEWVGNGEVEVYDDEGNYYLLDVD